MKINKDLIAVLIVLSIGTIFYHFVEHFRWIDSLYFSVMTLTTTGYGDFSPATDTGKVFTIFYVIIGFGIILNMLNKIYTQRVSNYNLLRNKIRHKKSSKQS